MKDLIIFIGVWLARCPKTIKAEHSLGPGGLGLDSMDILDLVAGLEGKYSLEISDEDWRKWETVQDVHDYLEAVKG